MEREWLVEYERVCAICHQFLIRQVYIALPSGKPAPIFSSHLAILISFAAY